MKINKIQEQPQFSGIHIATAHIKLPMREANLELYKLSEIDFPFLNNLTKSLNFRELYPNLTDNDYRLWGFIRDRVFQQSQNQDTFIVTKDNVPCGALKYSKKPSFYSIEGRITWPLEKGKKEPLAGKSLTLMLFNLFLRDNCRLIRSCVARNTSFDTVTKAISMGFGLGGGDEYNELMSIGREKIQKVIDNYRNIVEIEEKESLEDIPLENFLKPKKD